ncbi:MAG: hypothetical protein WED34_18270 [Planctomycetales bacterium]
MSAKGKPAKIPVSVRALMARINRRLPEYHKLKTNRRWIPRAIGDPGHYYVVDQYYNRIVAMHVDLETYGREIGALEPWECLEEE